jgi:hypothetical protein
MSRAKESDMPVKNTDNALNLSGNKGKPDIHDK